MASVPHGCFMFLRSTTLLLAVAALLCVTASACGEDPAVAGPGSDDDADAGEDAATDSDGDGVDTTSDDATADEDTITEDTVGEDTTGTDTGTDTVGEDVPGEDVSLDEADIGEDNPETTPGGVFQCVGREFVPEFSGEWQDEDTADLAEGQAGHSIEDLIVLPETTGLQVEGKFAYGTFSVDMTQELVHAYMDDCSGWLPLGTGETDDDGRVRFDIPSEALTTHARHEVRMVVDGDGTQARGYILSVPESTVFLVTDIDGTLTTSDTELFSDIFADIFGGDYVPEAYEGAADMVNAYYEAGYEILYLTGRPYFLDAVTRDWLETEGFPLGTVHFTRTFGEALPTDDSVGAYKRDYLNAFLSHFLAFRAYGNATTDIFAYLEVGLSTSDVYIIGPNAGDDGTQPVSSYPEHLDEIEIPLADQPF